MSKNSADRMIYRRLGNQNNIEFSTKSNQYIEISNIGDDNDTDIFELPKSSNLISITKKYLRKSDNISGTGTDFSQESSVKTLKFEKRIPQQSIKSNKYVKRITKIKRIHGDNSVNTSYQSSP